MPEKTTVSKTDLEIERIFKAELVPESTNLIKLSVDVGKDEIRQKVAGIAHICSFNKFGKQVSVINNVQPRRVFGVHPDLMNLTADDEATISLSVPERLVKIGSQIK